MKKKMVFAAALAALITGSIFAQTGAKPQNTVTGGVYVGTLFFIIPETGLNAEYERMLLGNNLLGIAAEADVGLILAVFPTYNFNVKARIYPFLKTFFLEAGLGYRGIPDWGTSSFLVPVNAGWKIDFGQPGGIVLLPSVGLIFSFGGTYNSNVNKSWKDAADTFNAIPGVRLGLRLGYSL
jgi:hypothetical protein